MYRMLLVDNDPLALEWLKQVIDWPSIGFTVNSTALNEKDALIKIEKNKPDVVIIEAALSKLDGLTLAKTIRSSYPETHIIFISKDNSYESMRVAVQVGAVDYLLKPVDPCVLQKLMYEVKTKCDESRSLYHAKKAIAAELIRHAYDQINTVPDIVDRLRPAFAHCSPGTRFFYVTMFSVNELKYLSWLNGDTCLSLGSYDKMFTDFAERTGGVLTTLRETKYVLITIEDPWPQFMDWKQKDDKMYDLITVCLYHHPVEVTDIPSTLVRLVDYCGWFVYWNGSGQVMYYQERPFIEIPTDLPDNTDHFLPRLVEAVRKNNTHEIEEVMNEFYADPHADNLHHQTMSLLDKLYESSALPLYITQNAQRKHMFFNYLLLIESVSMLKNAATEHIITLASDTDKIMKTNSHVLLAQKIKEFLEKHYAQPFSIEELTEEVGYSPNYLRSIYKKHTGVTILETLTEVRMRHAKQMLLDSKQTARKISQLVGYTNPSYFCMQFFKLNGVTPQQYREGKQ